MNRALSGFHFLFGDMKIQELVLVNALSSKYYDIQFWKEVTTAHEIDMSGTPWRTGPWAFPQAFAAGISKKGEEKVVLAKQGGQNAQS